MLKKRAKFLVTCFILLVLLGVLLPNTHWYWTCHKEETDTLVTFVIPSLGRASLSMTLSSLLNQTNPSWHAIVIGDGQQPQQTISDTRIMYVTLPKMGAANHGAHLRNFGIGLSTTPWVGFVDDDDTLASTYVAELLNEVALHPHVACVIFRMARSDTVIPGFQTTDIEYANVGISFALKKELYNDGFCFIPGPTEDFELLNRVKKAGRPMKLSCRVTYYVKNIPPPRLDRCTPTLLNF